MKTPIKTEEMVAAVVCLRQKLQKPYRYTELSQSMVKKEQVIHHGNVVLEDWTMNPLDLNHPKLLTIIRSK